MKKTKSHNANLIARFINKSFLLISIDKRRQVDRKTSSNVPPNSQSHSSSKAIYGLSFFRCLTLVQVDQQFVRHSFRGLSALFWNAFSFGFSKLLLAITLSGRKQTKYDVMTDTEVLKIGLFKFAT